jgi:hypothetical protein
VEVLGEKARSFQTAPSSGAMPTENEQIIQRGFDAFETADIHELRELPDGRLMALYEGKVRQMEVHTGHDSARRSAGV